jgi:glycosyltransferase involved in cell wall biosynthesis
MKILFCNKYDFPFSGTESYLFELMCRLERSGHDTALFTMDHGEPSAFPGRAYRIPCLNFKDPDAGLLRKVRLAAHALYSRSARRAMRDCIADFGPDLAHVRSIYHHLSPSILWELKRRRVPVLYHLNDFKILCPTYNMVAHGEACDSCREGAFHRVFTQDCYSGSRCSELVLAAEAYLHKWLQTYERCVDLFLAPSVFVRNQLIGHGFSADRIEVLSHFQELPPSDLLERDEGYVLYFGRLSPEKGVDDLLHALARQPHIPAIIAGDGPERPRLESLVRGLNLTRVHFAGHVGAEELHRLIARCSFSLFPSHAYETLGKSILESYAWARPVIASDRGSRHELVEDGVTGLLYPPGNHAQLADSLGFLFDHPDLVEKMGAAARARVRTMHDPEAHLRRLLEIYSRLAVSRKVLSFPRRSSPAAEVSPPRKVRVAFIGGRGVVSKYSGIESYYEQVGAELARLGHEVTIYCRTYFTPPISEHNGMRVLRLPAVRTKHLETVVHTFLSTLHAMLSHYDIVHYHCLGPSLFSFLPRLAGKKTVVTVQGLDWQRAKWGRLASQVLRWGESASVKFPDATMVVSRTLQRYYRDRYRRDTVYVPNGAALIPRRSPVQLSKWGIESGNYVLFLGRFSPEKNCHLLMEAFEKLQTNMKLVLAGGSSHSEAYVDKLRAHASPAIKLLPWKNGLELEELLSHAALFVLPSSIEGLSLALLDAMAAGVCVLASDIPENREVVEGAGFTFRCNDATDLRRMLDILIRDPGLRRQAAARQRARILGQYLWPGIARSIEAVYYDALGWPAAGVAGAFLSDSGQDIAVHFD